MGFVIAVRQLGAAIRRHQGCVLRRGDELRTILRGRADQLFGIADIFRDIVAGAKLNAGGAEICSMDSILNLGDARPGAGLVLGP